MPPRSAILAYAETQYALRQRLETQVVGAWRSQLDPLDILASSTAFMGIAAPLLASGKVVAAQLVHGYMAMFGLIDTLPDLPEPDEDAASAAFAALGPMVLAAIGKGRSAEDAIAYGAYLAGASTTMATAQAADAEVTRLERGWEGVVRPGACEACQANRGVHPAGSPMYRHGNCGCERVPAIAS